MDDISIIGLDLAKRVFQAHGARADGSVGFRKKLSRSQVLAFFAKQPRCIVAMEACATAHEWGRAIGELGHEVRLIPPIYVKPFVKRQKNDAADAEAICEAAQRPTMRFVPVKSEATRGAAMVFRIILSKVRSDTARRNRRFSASSSSSRLSWSRLMPPYCLRQRSYGGSVTPI